MYQLGAKAMSLRVGFVIGAIATVLLSGCGLSMNTNTPSYVKDVAAYKEGSDGIVVYFVLADRAGQPTAAEGNVILNIYESAGYGEDESRQLLHTMNGRVGIKEFQRTQVGLGAFKRDVVLCSFGRLTYSEIGARPHMSGVVEVVFDADRGGRFRGETTVSF